MKGLSARITEMPQSSLPLRPREDTRGKWEDSFL